MPFANAAEAEDFIFSDYMRVAGRLTGPDALTRTPALARRLLDSLDRPDRRFTSLLVTGSKGKGSISILTAKLLQALGYRVGLVTSPHIIHFRERIRLDGKAISEEDFLTYANRLEEPARAIMRSLTGLRYLSPAGLILALAAQYFADNRVDFAIIEAGRGGRFDDCGVLENPVAMFGPVLLEHPDKLGPTVEEIAAQKVALLKPGGVGLSVPQADTVLALMQAYAAQVGGGLLVAGREFLVENTRVEADFLRLDVQLRHNRFENLALPIPALYEADNLAVALGAVELVTDEQPLRPERLEALRLALREVTWPGRMQILGRAPFTLLDCAVNRTSAHAVLDSLTGRLARPLAAIVGVPEDRDWRGVLDELAPVCDYLVISQAANPRLSFPPEAAAYARSIFPPSASVEEAPDFARALALLEKYPAAASLLILGTQSFAADVLRFYGCDTEQL